MSCPIPFRKTGAHYLALLFLICVSMFLQRLSAQTNSSEPVTPSQTTTPPPDVVSYECDSLSVTNCCDQLLPDTLDQQACARAYDPAVHRRIKKITWQHTLVDSGVIDEGSGMGSLDPCENGDNCTLFILDSAAEAMPTSAPSPSPSPTPSPEFIEYDLPLNFSMPYNSGFVGNRRGGLLPEITVVNAGHSDFVITANDPQSSYVFYDVEIDSRAEQTPVGVLDFRGAKSVIMEGVTVVRNPVEGSTPAPENPNDIHAIRMGCIADNSPVYEVINSEIDLSLSRRILSARLGMIEIFDYHTGEAFHFSGCDGNNKGHAKFTFRDSRILLGQRSGQIGQISGYTGAVFGVDELADARESAVEFLAGSNCNSVFEISSDGSLSELTDNSDLDVVMERTGHKVVSNQKVLKGVVGLTNGNAWGLRSNEDGDEYSGSIDSWNFWIAEECGLDPRCPSTAAQFSVTFPAPACQTSTMMIEPTSTIMATTSMDDFIMPTSTMDPGMDMDMEMESTASSASPTMVASTSMSLMTTFTGGVTSTSSLTSSAGPSATPTPSTTMMTATAGSGGTASPGEGEGTASTISMTEIMPSPTPVPAIRMCEEMFEEGTEDRDVCEEYIEYPGFEFTRVVKVPHTQRTLSNVINITDTNTLFIFDADVPGSSSGSTASTEEPTPTPSPIPGDCTVCPTKTGIEYDLAVDFQMPGGSAFVGNGINGKHPELTIADDAHSAYVISVDNTRDKYLFAHIEIDSKLGSTVMDPSFGAGGILNLNGAGIVIMEDVQLVRRENIPHFNFTAVTLGCSRASTPTPTPVPFIQPVYTIRGTVIDISKPGGPQGFGGQAFIVSDCDGSVDEKVQLSIRDSTISINAMTALNRSSGTVFNFVGRSNTDLVFMDSACNHVVNSKGIDIAFENENYRYHYLGVLDHFQSNSARELFTGVFGLANGNGWGLIPASSGYMSDLRPWCFWNQRTPRVNVTCPKASVIAESCTPSPTIEPTTVFSTPDIQMTETTTVATSSEPATEVSSTQAVTSTPTSEPTATPTPTMTAGASTAQTTPVKTPTATPTSTETGFTSMGTDEATASETGGTTTASTAAVTSKATSSPAGTTPTGSFPTMTPGMSSASNQTAPAESRGLTPGQTAGTVVGVVAAVVVVGLVIAGIVYAKFFRGNKAKAGAADKPFALDEDAESVTSGTESVNQYQHSEL